jgi:hypothetical protein
MGFIKISTVVLAKEIYCNAEAAHIFAIKPKMPRKTQGVLTSFGIFKISYLEFLSR